MSRAFLCYEEIRGQRIFATIKLCVLPGVRLSVYGIPSVLYADFLHSVKCKSLYVEPVYYPRSPRESHAAYFVQYGLTLFEAPNPGV